MSPCPCYLRQDKMHLTMVCVSCRGVLIFQSPVSFETSCLDARLCLNKMPQYLHSLEFGYIARPHWISIALQSIRGKNWERCRSSQRWPTEILQSWTAQKETDCHEGDPSSMGGNQPGGCEYSIISVSQ